MLDLLVLIKIQIWNNVFIRKSAFGATVHFKNPAQKQCSYVIWHKYIPKNFPFTARNIFYSELPNLSSVSWKCNQYVGLEKFYATVIFLAFRKFRIFTWSYTMYLEGKGGKGSVIWSLGIVKHFPDQRLSHTGTFSSTDIDWYIRI